MGKAFNRACPQRWIGAAASLFATDVGRQRDAALLEQRALTLSTSPLCRICDSRMSTKGCRRSRRAVWLFARQGHLAHDRPCCSPQVEVKSADSIRIAQSVLMVVCAASKAWRCRDSLENV